MYRTRIISSSGITQAYFKHIFSIEFGLDFGIIEIFVRKIDRTDSYSHPNVN